jgi:Secretion system C-terminal sorting domain
MRNFIFKQVFLLVLTFSYVFGLKAQTATSSCNSVTVSNDGGGYPTNTFFANVGFKNCAIGLPAGCCRVITVGNPATPRFVLQQKQSNGTYTNFAGPQFSPIFTGVTTIGTYRVEIEVPRVDVTSFSSICPSGVTCFNISGQTIGMWGQWDPNKRLTNEVYVGATQPNDIQFSFVDDDNNTTWNLNEAKVINTSGTKAGSYDRYWLAIFEQNPPNRYWSQGWTFGQIPTTIDIGSRWGSTHGQFNQLTGYYLQLAAMNGCNTSGWIEANNNSQGSRVFVICPSGNGCKSMNLEDNITLSPNPTNISFRIMGIDTDADYSLSLTDLSGRQVKTFSTIANQDLDVSELPVGMYIAQLWNGSKKVQTTKLSIVK